MSVSTSVQDGLHIGHANVFHLCNKILDISSLLNASPQLHLLGLTETRLNLQSSSLVSIPNYHFMRKDAKQSGHTGMGIYVHCDITKFITRRSDLESEEVECMWLQFKRSEKDSLLLICFLYRNPASLYSWYDDFVQMMDVVTGQHNKANIILMGDFNLDMLKPQVSWESTFSLFGLKQLVTKPTRVTPTSTTLLDHIYTNNQSKISNVLLSDISISDHCPIICTWSCKVVKTVKDNHTTMEYRSFKRFNDDKFLCELSLANFADIYKCSNANDAVYRWYNIFLPIVDKHAPIRRKRVKHQTLPGWISKDIIEAMKLRDQLKKDKQFNEYKKQRNVVSQLVKNAKKEHFENMIREQNDTAHLWRAMNSITGKSKTNKGSNKSNFTSEELNKYFLSLSDVICPVLSHPSVIKQPISPRLEQFCDERLKSSESCVIPEIAVHEVGKYISNLANKKSMGIDKINAFPLKLALPYIVEPLTYLYNLCLRTNIFPEAWKCAKVVPLPKSSDTSELNNHRPISILSALSKPLEKHIHKHLANFVENHNLFHSLQSGFRKHHSCQTALSRMCSSWLSAINKCNMVGAVFIDLRKAFDLIDHDLLLNKLTLYTKSFSLVTLMRSFLSNRTQQVIINGSSSSLGYVIRGVPQGSILGPLLFCLFINDLPLHIINKNVDCDLFADDGSLHTSASNIQTLEKLLQVELNNVLQWCTNNKMLINPQKTKSMVITSRQKHQRERLKLNIAIGNNSIEQVKSHRVLGVTVDEELRWHFHINNVCKTVARNIYLLSKLKLYVDKHALNLFFHAHCMSHINYASTVWSKAGEVHLKKLNSLHRRAAKIIVPNAFLSTDQKLKSAGILPLTQQFDFNTAVLVYKTRLGLAPQYLKVLLLVSGGKYFNDKYILPQTRIDLFKSSFSFQGAYIWNSLPASVKKCESLGSFKYCLKKHFMKTNA